MVRSPHIHSESVDLDARTFGRLVTGLKSPNVWTVHIQNTMDLSNKMDYLRVNMKVSFGIGPNNSVYIIDDSVPTDAKIQYFNLPLSISYNEYLNEVRIVEYYSEAKYQELDKLVRNSLKTLEVDVSPLSNDISEDSEEKSEQDHMGAGFIQYLLNDSEQPYIRLSNWLEMVEKTEENAVLYDKLYTVWFEVMGAYTPPMNHIMSAS